MSHMRLEARCCCGQELNWKRTPEEFITWCSECGRREVVQSTIQLPDYELVWFLEKQALRRRRPVILCE